MTSPGTACFLYSARSLPGAPGSPIAASAMRTYWALFTWRFESSMLSSTGTGERILPPSFGELRRRLTKRGTETAEEIERRLRNARGELALKDKYQYLVVNDDLEVAYRSLQGIVDAEKQRSSRFFPVVEEE